MEQERARAIKEYLAAQRPAMVALLKALVLAESPTDVPEAQAGAQKLAQEALTAVGYHVTHTPGKTSGGWLTAKPERYKPDDPMQLLIGHSDTVWPLGTLAEMPLEVDGNVMRGPGVYDMKAGLVQMIFALQAVRDLALKTTYAPVVLINSDEERGSEDSEAIIVTLAQRAARAFILEPALGPEGQVKTGRKGVGQFEITVRGKAAHAGLDPEKGVSAIVEMAHIIQTLHELHAPQTGVTVNVGLLSGGIQSNVIAPHCRAVVDMRVPTMKDADRLRTAVYNLSPTLPGAKIEIDGDFTRPPLERTPANRALWRKAQAAGEAMGLALTDGTVGGASDGNLTSQYTATLDGLGPVGDGAHAPHEFIYLDKMVERSAYLATLLLMR